MILTIARKELKSLFASPLAWVVLAVTQLILAYGFMKRLDDYMQIQPELGRAPNAPGVTELAVSPLFLTTSIVFLFAVPLLAMRLIAEERRNKTLTLLISAPLTMTEIVIGKFAGLAIFLLLIVALTAVMPFSLLLGGHLDYGLVASLAIGIALLAGAFAAVGLYASCLTSHPVVAAMITLGLLLGMLLAGDTVSDSLTEKGWAVPAALARVFSPLKNFEPFARGMIDTYSLVCTLLLTVLFLVLAIRRLESQRLRG